ncbi:MAG TPA: hypothetical protein VG271_10410, partial [Beijerinckiaceae bacterium]|nr:hypothetical protein [Beijerinckiaceae bacterium]
MTLQRALVPSLALLLIAGDAGAADDAFFYAGKTVTIVVGTPAGGGFDTYARLLARHLGRHIQGGPNVIVANMPGADSNIAAAYVARSAAKDGTFIAAPNAPQPLFPIFGDA